MEELLRSTLVNALMIHWSFAAFLVVTGQWRENMHSLEGTPQNDRLLKAQSMNCFLRLFCKSLRTMDRSRWFLEWLCSFILFCGFTSGSTWTRFAEEPPTQIPSGPTNGTRPVEIRSTLNRDPKYGRWSASKIPYRIDQSYTPFQRTAIREAMTQIQSDVNNCVRFVEFDSRTDMGEDFINITPSEDGLPPTTCATAAGRDLSRGGLGQPLIMISGTGGCMDGKRDIMKILCNAVGLRNEFSRPDRDNFILIQPQNIRAEFRALDLYRKYQPSEVEYQNFPFDYQSITMYSQDRFAVDGSVAYHLVNTGSFVGNLARLSRSDCQAITAHYGCSSNFCSDPYAEGAKDKSIPFLAASWDLNDLNGVNFAKDLFQKPKGSSRRPFLIRPIAIL